MIYSTRLSVAVMAKFIVSGLALIPLVYELGYVKVYPNLQPSVWLLLRLRNLCLIVMHDTLLDDDHVPGNRLIFRAIFGTHPGVWGRMPRKSLIDLSVNRVESIQFDHSGACRRR